MNGTLGTLASVSAESLCLSTRPQRSPTRPASRATSALARECPSARQSSRPRAIGAFSEKCRAARTLPPRRRRRRTRSSSRAGSFSRQSLRAVRASSLSVVVEGALPRGRTFLSQSSSQRALLLASPRVKSKLASAALCKWRGGDHQAWLMAKEEQGTSPRRLCYPGPPLSRCVVRRARA